MRLMMNKIRRAAITTGTCALNGHFGGRQALLPVQEGVEGVIRVISARDNFKNTKSKIGFSKFSREEKPLIPPSTPSCGVGTVAGTVRRSSSSTNYGRPRGTGLLCVRARTRRQTELNGCSETTFLAPAASRYLVHQAPQSAGGGRPVCRAPTDSNLWRFPLQLKIPDCMGH